MKKYDSLVIDDLSVVLADFGVFSIERVEGVDTLGHDLGVDVAFRQDVVGSDTGLSCGDLEGDEEEDGDLDDDDRVIIQIVLPSSTL